MRRESHVRFCERLAVRLRRATHLFLQQHDGIPCFATDAEAVYREDLRRNPANGWALFGLAQALESQERDTEAAAVRHDFEKAWVGSDVTLAASEF